MSAKMIAKKFREDMCVTPHSLVDLAIMEVVVMLKHEQHPALHAELLTTGDATIIEDVSRRPVSVSNEFWGMRRNSAGEWEGANHLGKIWMRIREDAMKARLL